VGYTVVDVPGDVAIETSWQTWNENLKYPLSENGIRCLLRSGFSEISHLNLLRDSKANLAMLNLNYHDKLALEHALDAEGMGAWCYSITQCVTVTSCLVYREIWM